MTVASTLTTKQYVSTGVNTQFAFPNKIFSASDLAVTIFDLAGNSYIFTNFANSALGLTFSVQNVDVDTGCTVVLSAPFTLNWTIDIRSLVADTQSTSIKNQGQFLPELHEEAFDRATRQIQDLLRLTYTFGIHALDIETTAWPALPPAAARKGLALVFDPVTGLPTTGIPVTQSLTQGLIGLLFYPQTPAELAAGVTPSFYFYSPYDVRRYGAVGDGVTDDTAAFNRAGSIGRDIAVPETGSTYVLSSQVSGLFYAVGQPRFTTTYLRIGLVESIGTSSQDGNTGIVGSYLPGQTNSGATILVIGDSITQGTGVTTQINSWGWLFGRAIMNSSDEGVFKDSGYGYAHYMQWLLAANLPGVSTSGSLVVAGTWGSRLQLTVGQTLTYTLKEIKSLDVIYDATASAGCTFTIGLNGTVVLTTVVSGSGLKSTVFPTILKANGILTRLSDTITVTSTVGTLQIAAILDQKNSAQNAVVCYIAGQSGYAYQDYTGAAAITELSFYLNNPIGGARVLICQLGTNNMYNATKALSPTAMVTQIASLLTQLVTSFPNLQIMIAVPPKSNEALFPMILAFKYEDYVKAIVAYAVANNITLIRHDRSVLCTGAYYADGLHPNNVGATVMAATTAKAIGLKLDPYFKSTNFALNEYLTQVRTDAAIPMNSTWGPFGALTGFAARAHLVAGNLILSGVVIPNGSVSAQIGQLPAGYIPDSQDRYVILAKNVSGGALGTTRLLINHTTGALTLDAVPTNDVSLDGVCIPLNKNIEA